MRVIAFAAIAALAGCSTVESRRDQPPVSERLTQVSLQQFQGCFAERTSGQHVEYLPRTNGGSFSASAGPQNYVSWVVDVDDLGTARRVRVFAVNRRLAEKAAVPPVTQCS
jgi:hypothetical protein